jgi:hypothetical protein
MPSGYLPGGNLSKMDAWRAKIMDEDKTKEQLAKELASLQESLSQCTAALKSRNQDLDDLARYVVNDFKRPLGLVIGYAELLEEDYAALPDEDLHHCIRAIKQGGHRLGEMINGLLLLANSRRLFDNVWYAAYLATMREASLSEWAHENEVPEVYRYSCLPASSVPLVTRVWRTEDETSTFQAIAKLGGDRRNQEDKTSPAPQEAQWTLTREEWNSLLATIEESKFWADTSPLEQLDWSRMVGAGGEQWVFEGWCNGQYRVRAVWNPNDEEAHAAYALGRSFVNLLPGWFALEAARFWAANSVPEIHPRLQETPPTNP